MTLMPVSKICTRTSWSVKRGGARWMGQYSVAFTGPRLVHRLADDVEDAAEGAPCPPAPGWARRCSSPAWPRRQAVGGVHGDAAHGVLAQVLRHLEGEVVRLGR